MKNKILLSLVILTMSFQYSFSFDKVKLDSLFHLIEINQKGMGSISIFHNGKEVYSNAIGFADIGNKKKADGETIYRIGSISKTFTAVMLMQLVEERKINLNTTLDVYFPEITNSHKITMEMLLKHQSGLYNFTNDEDYLTYYTQNKSRKELLDLIKEKETVFNPGERTEYSNTNYVLLSLILEQIDSQPLAKIFKNRISEPLSLKRTFIGGEISIRNNEAFSYEKLSDWEKQPETNMSIPLGAGAVVSTPKELNLFFTALFKEHLLSDSSLSKMKQMKKGEMGLGLFEIPFYDKKGFGHSGGVDGFRSLAVYFPEDSLAISYLSNGEVMSCNEILIGALSIYFDKEYEIPNFDPAVQVDAKDLNSLIGMYSSDDFSLKIEITKKDNMLLCQATGQPQFALEALSSTIFQFQQAGLKLEFYPEENKMILKQGGGIFEFFKNGTEK